MSGVDVLVIGAGQAGLAAGYWLKKRALSSTILDSNARVGDSWRSRYLSLTLFTPRSFSSLPGLPLAGEANGYASAIEFADYLERYATSNGLNVCSGVEVLRLQAEAGGYVATTSTGQRLSAKAVIVATGGFQQATLPAQSNGFSPEVLQLTAQSYKRPTDIPPGSVLVVGDGASGRDIAMELAKTHRVTVAYGRPRRLVPEAILGFSIWHWLSWSGLLNAATNSPVGRYMRKADPFPNRRRAFADLRAAGVDVRPRLSSGTGTAASFSDGSTLEVTAVVWSTGYQDRTDWLQVAGAVDERGNFVHDRGRSPAKGLYFVGRPWQRNRASALIMGVGSDARLIVDEAKAAIADQAGDHTVKSRR